MLANWQVGEKALDKAIEVVGQARNEVRLTVCIVVQRLHVSYVIYDVVKA